MLLALVILGLGPETGSVNDKVVEFAISRLGQRVGDGDCSALAVEALRAAGARPPGRGRGDVGWGDELKSLGDARPGDILQFEDAVFVRKRVRDDGAVVTLNASYPHHTAVVEVVKRKGPRPVLVILHQNAGIAGGDEDDRRVVREWTIDLAEKKKGSVKAYRPVAARRGQDGT